MTGFDDFTHMLECGDKRDFGVQTYNIEWYYSIADIGYSTVSILLTRSIEFLAKYVDLFVLFFEPIAKILTQTISEWGDIQNCWSDRLVFFVNVSLTIQSRHSRVQDFKIKFCSVIWNYELRTIYLLPHIIIYSQNIYISHDSIIVTQKLCNLMFEKL